MFCLCNVQEDVQARKLQQFPIPLPIAIPLPPFLTGGGGLPAFGGPQPRQPASLQTQVRVLPGRGFTLFCMPVYKSLKLKCQPKLPEEVEVNYLTGAFMMQTGVVWCCSCGTAGCM